MSKTVSPAERVRVEIDEAFAVGAGRMHRQLFVVALIG
jgi:hypothetical protein